MTNGIEHLFICLFTTHLSFVNFPLKFLHAFYQVVCLLILKLWKCYVFYNLHIVWIQFFIRCVFCKCFLPAYGLPFHFLNSVFWRINVLLLIKFNLSILSLVHAFCILPNKLCLIQDAKIFPYVFLEILYF